MKIASWGLIVCWFAVIMGFVSAKADQVLCGEIDVHISDTSLVRFVTRGDIIRALEDCGMELQGYPISGINTRRLEALIEDDPYIRNAEVSTDISGRLEVTVEQCVPLMRVMPDGREGYYIGTRGEVLPLSGRFTPMVLLATGYIPYPDKEEGAPEKLEMIYRFGSYLASHPLWRNQVVQIYVNGHGEFELIPRVGAHHILMGTLVEWEKKLRNLELLYRQALPTYGWNSYETINLKHTNQVICTKR